MINISYTQILMWDEISITLNIKRGMGDEYP